MRTELIAVELVLPETLVDLIVQNVVNLLPIHNLKHRHRFLVLFQVPPLVWIDMIKAHDIMQLAPLPGKALMFTLQQSGNEIPD